MSEVNYGPLAGLIGVWNGDKGIDIAPEPKGTGETDYFETITFTAIGDVTNASKQTLSVLHYSQIVSNKASGDVFHHESGYWMWDPSDNTIMHSLVIPRGVAVLAGGTCAAPSSVQDTVTIEVKATDGDKDWNIAQSPFMQNNAKTTSFQHSVTVGNGKLSYSETTMLDIYGRVFEHTDANELTRG
ncbi:MAG: FABP family protein [Pseudomonadales bacterium]|nr:FABP family protein [Pseudomonadales bacterium]